jgi:hypothetical protein
MKLDWILAAPAQHSPYLAGAGLQRQTLNLSKPEFEFSEIVGLTHTTSAAGDRQPKRTRHSI